MPRGQQRIADDDAGAKLLVRVAVQPAIVVGQAIEVEVGCQPVEADRQARRPAQALLVTGIEILSRPGLAISNMLWISAVFAAISTSVA